MKTAYFDCSSGIAGNLVLGGLIDAGLPVNHLNKELKKLRITHYALRITRKKVHGINTTYFDVKLLGHEKHRNLSDITKIIKKSSLKPNIKKLSIKIFQRLAKAEAKVHGLPISKVHFHEVGATDAIIDIVGTVIGLDYFEIEEVFSSPINVGSGKIKHSHGIMPIPAPATSELLKGIPIYDSGIKKELTTPTGAAIISTIASRFENLPRLKVEDIGFGAGSYDIKEQPNYLRIIIGEKELETQKDAVLLIETNIDDMNPKLYDKAIKALMKVGALDAWIEPIRMKKQRNAIKLSVLSKPENKDRILKTIFLNTTSIGTRISLVQREKLNRHFASVKTNYGKLKIKIGKLGNSITNIAPEFEDYKQMSKKHRLPIENKKIDWLINY